jgi:LysM domain
MASRVPELLLCDMCTKNVSVLSAQYSAFALLTLLTTLANTILSKLLILVLYMRSSILQLIGTHSGSADGTLRYWEWTTGATKNSVKQDRMHVVDSGENVSKIAKRYACTVPQLLLRNGIRDARQVSEQSFTHINNTFNTV